jgi:hypothetical protein
MPASSPGQDGERGSEGHRLLRPCASRAADRRRLPIPRGPGTGSRLVTRGIPRRCPLPRGRRTRGLRGPPCGSGPRAGHRVLFATATGWVSRLAEAHDRGRLPQELAKLRRYKLLIVDEVGYIPFDQDSANLFVQLVSSRYEHASMVLTSNLAFSRWGEVFSYATVASAMIDRIVHHAEVLNPLTFSMAISHGRAGVLFEADSNGAEQNFARNSHRFPRLLF